MMRRSTDSSLSCVKCFLCGDWNVGIPFGSRDKKTTKHQSDDVLKSQLWVLYVMRKILKLPQEIEMRYISEKGNPTEWGLEYCKKCQTNYLSETQRLFEQLYHLNHRLKSLRNALRKSFLASFAATRTGETPGEHEEVEISTDQISIDMLRNEIAKSLMENRNKQESLKDIGVSLNEDHIDPDEETDKANGIKMTEADSNPVNESHWNAIFSTPVPAAETVPNLIVLNESVATGILGRLQGSETFSFTPTVNIFEGDMTQIDSANCSLVNVYESQVVGNEMHVVSQENIITEAEVPKTFEPVDGNYDLAWETIFLDKMGGQDPKYFILPQESAPPNPTTTTINTAKSHKPDQNDDVIQGIFDQEPESSGIKEVQNLQEKDSTFSMNSPNGRKSLSCLKCFAMFPDTFELRLHEMSCSTAKPKTVKTYSCESCPRVFVSEREKFQHESSNNHIKERSDQFVYCDFCHSELSSKYAKKRHMLRCIVFACLEPDAYRSYKQGIGLKLPSGLKEVKCSWCGMAFRYSWSKKRHQLKCPKRPPDYLEERQRKALSVKYTKDNRCLLCNEKFPSRSKVAYHVRYHHQPKSYCDTCGKSVRCMKTHLKFHEEKGKPAEIMCELCSSCFTSIRYLRQHYISKHAEQLNIEKPMCRYCGKRYPTKYYVEKHIRVVHTKNASIKCEICGLGFEQQSNFKTHMKIHEGVKLECGKCKKMFSNQYSLNRHIRRHNGERPYSCRYCNKTFVESSDRKYHEDVHLSEPRHECEICGKRFQVRGQLKYHIKSSHPSSASDLGNEEDSSLDCKVEHIEEHIVYNEIHLEVDSKDWIAAAEIVAEAQG